MIIYILFFFLKTPSLSKKQKLRKKDLFFSIIIKTFHIILILY